MTDDKKPWDGVPENPERDGLHWLKIDAREQHVATIWNAELASWVSGAAYSPGGVVELGFRYLGSCLTPAEVSAREAAAFAAGAETLREIVVREVAKECTSAESRASGSWGYGAESSAARTRHLSVARALKKLVHVIGLLPLPLQGGATIRSQLDTFNRNAESIRAGRDK